MLKKEYSKKKWDPVFFRKIRKVALTLVRLLTVFAMTILFFFFYYELAAGDFRFRRIIYFLFCTHIRTRIRLSLRHCS